MMTEAKMHPVPGSALLRPIVCVIDQLCRVGALSFILISCAAHVAPSPDRTNSSRPTGDIEGRIKNGSGEPVPHAGVLLRGVRRAVQADSAGHYLITLVPVGTCVLETRAMGYDPQERPVSVHAGRITRADFKLDDKVLRTRRDSLDWRSFGEPGSVLSPCMKRPGLDTDGWNSVQWDLDRGPRIMLQLPRTFAPSGSGTRWVDGDRTFVLYRSGQRGFCSTYHPGCGECLDTLGGVPVRIATAFVEEDGMYHVLAIREGGAGPFGVAAGTSPHPSDQRLFLAIIRSARVDSLPAER